MSVVRQIAVTLAELDAMIAERIARDEERAAGADGLCAGVTLESTYCRHRARSGSRYCYLHAAQEERAS